MTKTPKPWSETHPLDEKAINEAAARFNELESWKDEIIPNSASDVSLETARTTRGQAMAQQNTLLDVAKAFKYALTLSPETSPLDEFCSDEFLDLMLIGGRFKSIAALTPDDGGIITRGLDRFEDVINRLPEKERTPFLISFELAKIHLPGIDELYAARMNAKDITASNNDLVGPIVGMGTTEWCQDQNGIGKVRAHFGQDRDGYHVALEIGSEKSGGVARHEWSQAVRTMDEAQEVADSLIRERITYFNKVSPILWMNNG